MDCVLVSILFLSFSGLVYIYGGYRFFLSALVRLKGNSNKNLLSFENGDFTPGITVYFPALNEEKNIHSRISNIIDQNYPSKSLEIIIVSDGSTDKTAERVNEAIMEFPQVSIRLIDFESNLGRATAQNTVAKEAKHDILISTDAETVFDKNLLRELVKPFQNPGVGAVGAITRFVSEGAILGESYKMYRNMEYEIRKLETRLGICVKTDGACTAYLRSVWEHISDFEDVDHVIAIFSRKKNRKVVLAENAFCLDRPNTRRKQEIKARARMTRKTLLSTFSRWKFRDFLNHPAFSFALFSHRIIRVFSPVFLFLAILSLIIISHRIDLLGLSIALIAGGSALLWLNEARKIPFVHNPLSHITHFFYANTGFALGIIGWLRGNREGRYNPARRE